ncbi:kinase-like protein [Lophium mytilinum]|uniref:Kinase-like protein n=1 Tax=Lophium mytilinum TaxID=390894 RepID=A0A6A6R270_9PEZI|nr:kinase-like protein [Lophium mytilinum]
MSESTLSSKSSFELLDDRGYTATVYRIPGTKKVCKISLEKCQHTNFLAEKIAYERFAARKPPSTIPRYYGIDENHPGGLLLEYAEKGNLRDYLFLCNMIEQSPPSPELIYRWARQAAEALSFAHSCGVLHADIHCSNFLLDSNYDLKVADFAGASIDGSKSWSCYRYSHRLFEPGDNDGTKGKGMKITVRSEIFAMGSAMYAMVQGHDPFVELEYANDWEGVKRRILEKEMPDISCLPILGDVIRRCWDLEYAIMEEVLDAIELERCSSWSHL